MPATELDITLRFALSPQFLEDHNLSHDEFLAAIEEEESLTELTLKLEGVIKDFLRNTCTPKHGLEFVELLEMEEMI